VPEPVRKFSDWEDLNSSKENVNVAIKEKVFQDFSLGHSSEDEPFSAKIGPPLHDTLKKQLSGIAEEADPFH